MFNETAPQDYLNDLHAIGIPKLFHPRVKPRDRANGIQIAKKELGRLKVELQHHRDTLRSKNKSESSEEIKRLLAPYNLLQNLIQQLIDEVKGLEEKLGAGKMLPQGFEFGQYIFGDEDLGEWFIGDEDHYEDWREADDVKQRLNGFKSEGQPLINQMSEIHSEYETQKSLYQSTQKKVDKHTKAGYILRRMALLFILIVASGAGGAYVYLEMNNTLGFIGLGLAGIFFLLMPLGYMDWRRRNRNLIATTREAKTQMRRLQAEGKAVQKRYRPIEFQIRALSAQYDTLRAGLSGGKQATEVA